MKVLIVISVLAVGVFGDVSFIKPEYSEEYDTTTTTTTPQPPPHPYVFSYSAGRYPGHIDRTHSESSDGSGVVQGRFQYVDPKHEIRTVEYTADEYGFHPVLSHEPKGPEDTDAVKYAKDRHFYLYNKLAERNSQPASLDAVDGSLPKETAAVEFAKHKHFTLFDKIAMEHAHIAEEREAERLAYEATHSPNDVQFHHQNEY